jgi:hypothetical protein
MQLFNRGNRSRRARRHYRRNPALAGIIPGNLMSVRGITGSIKSFAVAAVPVTLGYAGVRLLDSYVWAKLWDMGVNKWTANSEPTTKKIVNSLWDTFTHVVTASVGAGIAVKIVKRRDAAALFAAGVAVNWVRKMAVIWLPEGQMKAVLAGNDDDLLSDYVQYDVPSRMNDYVETNEGGGVGDYVESY